jgi:hypothetical protein
MNVNDIDPSRVDLQRVELNGVDPNGVDPNRVDLGRAVWRKSNRSSASGDCVEVARNLPGVVAVRDSKNPNGAALLFTHTEWAAFVGGVKDGEFD